jgi:hypothetical protein
MRRLHQILKGESTFDDLLQRHRREAMLQDCVHRALPSALARNVAVIDARTEELELGAASGAAAALLRQRAPELRAALAREGFEFTVIRVRVQARLAREQAHITAKKQLDSTSAAIVSSLADELGQSPLAAALRRLAGPREHTTDNTTKLTPGTAVKSSGRDKSLEGVKDEDAEQ